MSQSNRKNTVGPWAQIKLDALEKYLTYYCTALKNKPFKRIYIDAFAGDCVSIVRDSGLTENGRDLLWDTTDVQDQKQFILGSPMRALGIETGFHQYYFFDLDKHRAEKLRQVTEGKDNVEVQFGDCNPKICELAPNLNQWDIRGVAFLDPYGPHLEWKTIEALAETRKMEVVINFPLAMAINRLITKSGEIRDNWQLLLTKCFGTEGWQGVAYNNERNLFGEIVQSKRSDVPARLLELYVDRLKKLFRYVAKPRLIFNTRGNPLYYLIWAGPNKLGLKGAEYILGQDTKIQALRAHD